MSAPKTKAVTKREAIRVYRRVLKLVDLYMKRNLSDTVLVCGGNGMMTWGEVRNHIRQSLKLKVMRR